MNKFPTRLHLALQQMYDRISECEDGLLKPVAIDRGLTLLQKLGYPPALLEALPPESFDQAFPLANPFAKIVELEPGTMLDLGCGSVLDVLGCALMLPQLKEIVAIDSSSGLLEIGRRRLQNFPEQSARITLLKADLNHIKQSGLQPADLILMNGSFNLVYNKTDFFKQLTQLLRNDGSILIYDFLLSESLPPGFADEVDNWLWNIGGALSETELRVAVKNAGLEISRLNELERIDPVARCEIVIRKKA